MYQHGWAVFEADRVHDRPVVNDGGTMYIYKTSVGG